MDTKQLAKKLIGTSLRADIEKRAAVSLTDRFGKSHSLTQLQYSRAKRAERGISSVREHCNRLENMVSAKRELSECMTELTHLKGVCQNFSVEDAEKLIEETTVLKEELEDTVNAVSTALQKEEYLLTEPGQEDSDILCWRLDGLPTVTARLG
uniref:Tegument protein UL14 n=1 Tax=Wood mouse herpesvirus TaxID=432370 RepID=D0PPC4_9GAMA|nr:tegument protein UL14 [Wood mouse herpesvirus]